MTRALRHRHEEALLLLLRAGEVERPAAEARVRRDDQPERAPDAPDLLDRDGVGERVEAGSALVLGDRDAEPAQLADAPHDLDREAPLALVLLDDRRDLGEHEVADRVAQERVLGREVEVHRRERTSHGRTRPDSASAPVLAFAMPEPPRRSRPSDGPAAPSAPGSARRVRRGGPSSLRRDLLLRLRLDGPVLARPARRPDSARRRTGVLQQLRALEAAHLVSRQTVRHGVGRPRHLYDVTADAQDLFPSTYDALAAGLLAAIERGRRRRPARRGLRRAAAPARRPRPRASSPSGRRTDAPLSDRVRELAVIQAEQGYLAEASVDADGTIRLREHNCAIYHVAQGHRRPPARRSSSCSARSSAPTSSARRTSPRATAAAPTGSLSGPATDVGD